jgi:hypothetical protein
MLRSEVMSPMGTSFQIASMPPKDCLSPSGTASLILIPAKPVGRQHIARGASPVNLRLITQNLPLISYPGLGHLPYPGKGLLFKLSLRFDQESSLKRQDDVSTIWHLMITCPVGRLKAFPTLICG